MRPNIFGSLREDAKARRQVWALLVTFLFCVGGCASSSAEPGEDKTGWRTKIGPELIALYDEYSSYLASGQRGVFISSNPLVRVVEDRVIVDAVASGDADVLKANLEGLGMQQAVTFGRVVSGQLPIVAIRALATLPSLNLARAATAVLQGVPRSRPDIPSR